jgi:hypothetical protein
MHLYEETLKIFQDHVTAPTREKALRRLFRVVGEESSISQAPLHTYVCGILKAKLSEHETEKRLRALIGMDIQAITPKPEISSEAKVLADEIRAELGLTPRVDPEAAERAMLAKAYPSLLGPEPLEYDPLEGCSPGEREIVENFYGSGKTMSFVYQDHPAPEPIDPELEEMALGLYPTMKRR